MDCCNYVQPYARTGHFYPQHQFYYENMTADAYAAYGAHRMSNVIENSAFRYNRMLSAYPTDYVYNPKEARLRKAMREQSRELSRQSILQTTIASSASESAVTNCVNSSGGNFSHPSHALTCATPPASPLSATSSINANRIIGPWFPVGHAAPTSHLKPILTPRVQHPMIQPTIDLSQSAFSQYSISRANRFY